MKNRITTIFLFAFILLAQMGYAQDILWEKSYGGRFGDYLFDAQPTADYGFILAGSSLSNKSGNKEQESTGDLDYLIWKMDESGGTNWQKSFGGSGSDLLKVLKNTSDGGFILGGASNSPEGFDKKEACRGGNDYWIIKLDAKGNLMWQRVFGGKGTDDLTELILTKDGGYLIGGSSSSSAESNDKLLGRKKENSRGSLDYWIIKLDGDGNEIWQRTYGGKYADVLQSMVTTKDGGYLIGGYSNSPASKDKTTANLGEGNDFWILKLDLLGAIEWQQVLGGSNEDQLKVVCQTKDGNYIAAGSSNSETRSTKNGTDVWVVKIDATGAVIWERAHDIGKNDILTSLIEQEDESFILGAYSPSGYIQANNEEGINDYVALKLSSTGEELWRKVNGSNGEDVLKKLIETRDGGYLMVGTSNPEFNGYTPKNKSGLKGNNLNPLNTAEQVAGAKKLQEGIDAKVNEYAGAFNSAVKEQTTAVVNQVNEKIDAHNKTGFKVGMNGPVGDLLNPTKGGSGASADAAASFEKFGPKPGSKISRDKKVNYGGTDYWVVKLKDKEREIKEKVTIEAFPNPVMTYTNVIIGFDFDYGTASVYDLGGRELQSYKIDQRTVPVNLADYSPGIYIINIKTNKGEGGVKVIKK
jgi:hypothetical protein